MYTRAQKLLIPAVFYVVGALLLLAGGTAEAAVPEPWGIAPPTVCSTPTIEQFTPYIYDGELHSFEYTVRGSEMPLVSQTVVGGRVLEYRFVTQRRGAGEARIHVDVPTWYGYSGETAILATVLTGADPHCVASGQFAVTLKLQNSPSKPSGATAGKPAVRPPEPPLKVVVEDREVEKDGAQAATPETAEASLTHRMLGTMSAFLGAGTAKSECRTLPLWGWAALAIVALVALLAIVDRLPYLLRGNGVKFALALLLIFAVMIGVWLVFDRCRHARWFPIAITLFTLLTLLMPTALDAKKLRAKK